MSVDAMPTCGERADGSAFVFAGHNTTKPHQDVTGWLHATAARRLREETSGSTHTWLPKSNEVWSGRAEFLPSAGEEGPQGRGQAGEGDRLPSHVQKFRPEGRAAV